MPSQPGPWPSVHPSSSSSPPSRPGTSSSTLASRLLSSPLASFASPGPSLSSPSPFSSAFVSFSSRYLFPGAGPPLTLLLVLLLLRLLRLGLGFLLQVLGFLLGTFLGQFLRLRSLLCFLEIGDQVQPVTVQAWAAARSHSALRHFQIWARVLHDSRGV